MGGFGAGSARRVRRWLAGALGAAVLTIGAAAAPAAAPIRVGIPTAPVTLDPRFATDAVSYRIVRLLHRAPSAFDTHSQPVPDLARWEALSPTRYRFALVDGAHFSDGTAVTAQDVAATYRSVLDPATASPHRGSLHNIAHIEVLDARTLEFHLERPDVLFPGTLVVGVLAARDLAGGGRRAAWTLSSGLFERLVQAADGSVLLRRRSDGQRFEFVPVKDLTVRAFKLLGGELDIVQGNIAPEIYAWLAARPGLHAQRVPGTTFSYLGFNLDDAVSGQRAVRQAIAHAIDREAIVRHVFAGTARLAAALFPPEHWAGGDALEAPAYDPAAARRLLAAAGYGERRLQLEYKTSSDHFRLRLAAVFKSQLARVGIDLSIQSYDWGTFYGDVTHGRFQIYGLSWVGLKLPDAFRYAFHSASLPPVGANRGRYRAAAVDRLIERAEVEPERARRIALYHALQERLLYDLPYVPLWFEDQLVITRADIAGYTTDSDGSFDALATTFRRRDAARR